MAHLGDPYQPFPSVWFEYALLQEELPRLQLNNRLHLFRRHRKRVWALRQAVG